jgi:energy-coupling factor transporter ATP-binding protein EcfA2
MGLDGVTSPDHYYWLAYEWQNLHPICAQCLRNKLNRFPVAGGRAAPGSIGKKLEASESRLLLDPCLDLPEEQLLFGDAGHVASLTLERGRSGPGNPPFNGYDIGTITIDTFGLNRPDLIAGRRDAAQQTEAALGNPKRAVAMDRAELERTIAELTQPSLAYAMVRRQVAARWLEKLDALSRQPVAAPPVSQSVSKPSRARAFKRLERHEAQQASAAIQDEATYARTTRISHVEIENFRGIPHLEFDVPTTGWKMLIGENGTGKSSILQAIAIALMGRTQANRLRSLKDLEPAKLVRRGTSAARISVHQAASIEPIEVTITPRGFTYPPGRAHQKAVLLGFGSARWLPRPRGLEVERDDWIRVRNLLNPFVPLSDANRWLRDLRPGTTEFRTAEAVVRTLLRFDATTRVRVLEGQVRVQRDGERRRSRWLTLDQLSDGYQSALAMATAILGPLFSKWDVVRDAEGVVLIDELDAHLHPRWKMRIVGDLRNAFPRVQFVASTHEPLCLRGILEREILSLRRDNGKLIYTDDLPSPAGLRVDQLLTSRFFGLNSTFDPESEVELERYYELLALDKRSTSDDIELQGLQRKFGREGVLGDTPRDQVIYAVIDKYIATDLREEDPEKRRQRRSSTEQRVAELWRDAVVDDRELERALADVFRGSSK